MDDEGYCSPSGNAETHELAIDALIGALAAMTVVAGRAKAEAVRTPDGCNSTSTSRFAHAYYECTYGSPLMAGEDVGDLE